MLNYTLSLSDMNELEDTEQSWVEISGFLLVCRSVCGSLRVCLYIMLVSGTVEVLFEGRTSLSTSEVELTELME